MKVVVLGGAGDMGSEAVRELIKFTGVKQVTVADINTEAAEKLASAIGDKRVAVEKVDATSHLDLVGVIKGHDGPSGAAPYTYLRAHQTKANILCRLLLEKKKDTEDYRVLSANHIE